MLIYKPALVSPWTFNFVVYHTAFITPLTPYTLGLRGLLSEWARRQVHTCQPAEWAAQAMLGVVFGPWLT